MRNAYLLCCLVAAVFASVASFKAFLLMLEEPPVVFMERLERKWERRYIIRLVGIAGAIYLAGVFILVVGG